MPLPPTAADESSFALLPFSGESASTAFTPLPAARLLLEGSLSLLLLAASCTGLPFPMPSAAFFLASRIFCACSFSLFLFWATSIRIALFCTNVSFSPVAFVRGAWSSSAGNCGSFMLAGGLCGLSIPAFHVP